MSRLIHQAVDGHKDVLETPASVVIFDDFGDNALIFDVYFWCHVENEMELRRVRSDIRFRIDELFREAQLVISYPQRDVHVDTTQPLEVRMVGSEGNSH